jgi:fructosamine-3-kinase
VLPDRPEASLVHGDLWGGNFLVAETGAAALVDPAVYFGHRETDLAMTELFGGFDERFYGAYREEWSLEPGYEERREIYNLYHLLNHLNHFGGGYAGAVGRALGS